MARRRTKKRTHVGAQNGAPGKSIPQNNVSRAPKSMVIRIGAGEVGPSVSQLVKDVRSMMEPGTAARLKERRGNRLRDYLTMAGPLGVSHLLLFSRSETGNTNLRLALTPRGPTLHFQVEKYSLCKDVRKAMKHPKGGGKEYLSPPLVSSFHSHISLITYTDTQLQLVMNNFQSRSTDDDTQNKIPKHLESLSTTIFQSLFPPIAPQTTPLSSIRRVMLLNREPAKDKDDNSYVLNLRHYAITTKATGLSKPLRRLNAAEKLMGTSNSKTKKGGVPNLGKLEDIADYMIGGDGDGYMTDATSGSEVDTDAEVEVISQHTKKILSKRQKERMMDGKKSKSLGAGVEKRAIKLVELGPRMKLRMTKVEEGVCSGKIMWHEYIHKSKDEVGELEKKWEKRRSEKEGRKKIQKENVERKRAAKEGTKSKKSAEEAAGDEEEDDNDLMDTDPEWDSDDIDGGVGVGGVEEEDGEDEEGWEDDGEDVAGG